MDTLYRHDHIIWDDLTLEGYNVAVLYADKVQLLWLDQSVYHTRIQNVNLGKGRAMAWNRHRYFSNWECT